MENIFSTEFGSFSNRTRTADQITAEYARVYPKSGDIIAHKITAEILKIAVGSEFELFNSADIADRIILINNLIIDSEITDPAHILRIIRFDNSDFAYVHHLIGHGFHTILNQI